MDDVEIVVVVVNNTRDPRSGDDRVVIHIGMARVVDDHDVDTIAVHARRSARTENGQEGVSNQLV